MTDPKARQRESARKWARKERARLKAAGLVPVTVYVRPEDRERVKLYAAELTGDLTDHPPMTDDQRRSHPTVQAMSKAKHKQGTKR